MPNIDWSNPLIVVELIKIFPNCLLIFLVVLFLVINRSAVGKLFRSVTHLGAFGVDVNFAEAKAELRNAIGSYMKDYRAADASIDDKTLRVLLNQAEMIKDLLRGARILWVDDLPLANAAIFRFLNTYGVNIDHARTTIEAVRALEWSASAYEVVVSDMERDGNGKAGLELLAEIKGLEAKLNTKITVIIFINKYDASKGTPDGAALITNRVEFLFKKIFNVIEEKQLQMMDMNP
jgi:CheY-like chemotaxis protein